MASISGCAKADEADLVGHLSPVIGVGDEEDTVAELIEWPRLKGSCVEYPTALVGLGSSRSDQEPLKLNNRTITKGINCKVSRKKYFIDVVAREGTGLKAVLKELEISRFKRVASKDNKVRISQAKRRLAGKTPGPIEEKLITSELNIPLKLTRLNKILDGPVDMAMVSSTAVQILAKRKAIKRGLLLVLCRQWTITFARALRDVQLGSLDRSMELEKKISQLEGEKKQLEEKLTRERIDFQLEREKEKEAAALKLKQVNAESEAEAERLVTASAISRNNLAGMLYQLRYMTVEITAFTEGNYEEMEIMDEEEEIENSRLRVVDLEGLLEVEKKSSAVWQTKLDTAREREEQALLYNAEYAEEYEALISQYEDRLDDNVKLSLKLEEAKRQVEEKTATILSRDLALNQLTSELVELKEKAASGSWHEAELAEYRIRALNKEISDMKCNIRALNELLLKREIDRDTARTNLVVSEADFEKLSSSIVGKDRELRNSEQICDSLIARLDRLKADLRRLKGKEAQRRADLVEIQAKNQNLVDDLAHSRGNVRRATQREKEMNERINQLCARISESERELRVRELKYQKNLKFELDKRDCEIAFGQESREMKEFLHRKDELVENMRIDLANSWQKSIDLTRQMRERIDQLIPELAESKARGWKDNKRAAVTHQAFKELVVHEQEKYDGEVLHQRQSSSLVAFFVEEIKFLIDTIGVMDRGIGTTTAVHIARGREIVAERAPEYMASRTKIGGRSSVVSPTPIVVGRSSVVSLTPVAGGRSTGLPSRKSSRVKMKSN
ncbi:hypothetical protein GIB67_021204 [Kingdonia uniflora]|uniref:Uncharacterized protein n=1 Tax=Kingdonia uniflora TaxID=39325 RepID=A0A7J7LFQ1_9MAGN|nr:hypothetical protein GIB67_021204 [Kingdonia uniflora]